MLKATVLMLGLLPALIYEQPAGPALDPNPNYPLHVHVLSATRPQDRYAVHGYGKADLLGPTPVGMDYTYDCSIGFLHNGPITEYYQARWKKPNRQMEFLIQQVGDNKHVEKCTVNVTLKSVPYYNKYPASMLQAPAGAPAAAPVP